ncbi:hypothetical protein [Breznakia pachnodae]|uniref:Membrane protein n=1 Tax=Breznakia pachnodae TaxID=265178 RepID=A0ABU0E8M2_9FIRM|nr:hypothetical protein [Breznakia pachnodae]MDQ0363235.1 putative membrane protein [Breznakia pachnodae]
MILLKFISLLKPTTEAAADQPLTTPEIITLVATILTALGFGSVFVAFLNHYLRKRSTITEIDNLRFDFYRYIYFSGISTPLYEKMDIQETRYFLYKLRSQLYLDDDKSLLLSKKTLNLFNIFLKDDSDRNTNALICCIEKEFNQMLKLHRYRPLDRSDLFKYRIIFIIISIFLFPIAIISFSFIVYNLFNVFFGTDLNLNQLLPHYVVFFLSTSFLYLAISYLSKLLYLKN